MKMEESAPQTVSSVDQPSSAVVEVSIQKCAEDETKDEYRMQVRHAGQLKCKLIKLMFETEEEGEVQYRIVSWDSCPSDGLGQKEPAGPLYSINCHKGKDDVADVTGSNVEMIQPQRVTRGHGLSLLALLRALIFQNYPIPAQVLLSYINLKGKHRKSKLHMHLLPGNVPIEEVKKHECNAYIESSTTCDLIPGKEYQLVSKTTKHKITIKPEIWKFKRDYGPNYHPTFEVFFSTEVDEVALGLLDDNKEEVWSRLVLIKGMEAASTKLDLTGADFVDKHRAQLIQRVSSVLEITDRLMARRMISDEMYSNFKAATTSQDKMRELFMCLTTENVKVELYKILREKQPFLVEELESQSNQD